MVKKIFLTLIFAFLFSLCKSQYFQNINLSNGLSQPSVMAISQDALGRMWFGTREGINIYDGVKITSFKGEIANGKSQKIWIGNEISYIVKGENVDWNKIFFISDFSLYSFDIRTNFFTQIETQKNVTAILYHNNKLFYAQNNNIFSYDSKSNKKSIYKILPEGTIINTILMADNCLYVGTRSGVVISPLNAIWEETNLLFGEDIYRIFRDSRKNLWIGTRMKGLYRIVNGNMEKVPVCPNGTDGIIDPQIREFVEDNNGNIWFGTFMGLQEYDFKKNEYRTIKIPKYAGGLDHPSIFSLYKDRQGVIWAGSYYGGINYFNSTKSNIVHYDYQIKNRSEIFYSYIAEMDIDKRNNLWVSTDGGGISCLNDNWEIIKQFTSKNNNSISSSGLPHNNIKSICYDKKHDMLYIGTHLGGLSRYDIQNNRFYNYLSEQSSTDTVPGNIIHHIEIWNDDIYISSRNGVFRLDPETDKFTVLTEFPKGSIIFDIDKNGTFYFVEGGKLIIIPLGNSHKKEVVDIKTRGEISYILATDNKLYISTLGCGLIEYDKSSRSLKKYTTENSDLPSNYCYSSGLTNNNKLILTGDKGITMFDIEKNTFLCIRQNYLKAPIINGCGVCVSDDYIYIGDTKGITRIDESDFTSVSGNTQPIYFSEIYINNNKVSPSASNNILKESLAFTGKINLKHYENNVTIEFAKSNYTNEHVQQVFEYKLEGLDKGWNSTTIPVARYTNLYPGKYKLYVKTAGDSNAVPAILEIIISTAWYNTWWAWFICIMIVIAITEIIIRYRNEKKNLSLSLEKERFEKQNIELLNHEKLVFFTNVSHEFRTPLTLIISHIESLLQMSSLPPAAYNKIMKLRQNAMYMNNLVSELLDFRKFTQNRYTLSVKRRDMVCFIKEIFLTFNDYANEKGLEYKFSSKPEEIICWFDEKQLEKVFFNIISNAFKYTNKGGIYIHIHKENDKVYISIQDTGKGISKDDSARIFERFYQIDNTNKGSNSISGTGIGLALTKSIVEKHHGIIAMESNLGTGSTFTVILPIECSEYTDDEHIRIEETSCENTDYIQDTIKAKGNEYNISIDDPYENSLPAESGDNKKYTLLLVEDNPELIQALGELFSSFYNILKATNGKDGLEKAHKHKPDIIISDIMMPEMSGTEMCLHIKSSIDLCHIPVILLTALNSTEQNIEGLNRGADDYISKPFNAKILLARANNLVRNRLLIQHQISNNPISEVDLTSINPIDQDILRKTSKAIEAHIDDPDFDIPELCKEIGIGRSVLYSKFKSLTGMTPNNYILNYRLKYAATMLRKYPDMPVAEIGDKCGFSSPVYFGRCFKNQYGTTPQNYRKNNNV